MKQVAYNFELDGFWVVVVDAVNGVCCVLFAVISDLSTFEN